MRTDVSDLYFNWLKSIIRDRDGFKLLTHEKLIRQLHSTPFYVLLPNDQPREDDGVDLRWRFAWECGHSGDELMCVKNIPEEKCSVLEMMVALSLRTDENFTKQNNYETTMSWVFWTMVSNMGLLPYTDNVYDEINVSMIIDTFNNRMYHPNGMGGLFYFPTNCTDDMRQIEIWHQLCWWVNSL